MNSFKGIRLYVDVSLRAHEQLTLSPAHVNYLINVMRKKVSDRILLFNGQDGEWLAEICSAEKKHAAVEVLEQTRKQKQEPDIWLVFAPVKHVHTDFIIEKATELGVSDLFPVFTERTIATRVNEEKFKSNAIEAAELAERLSIPNINPAQKFSKLLSEWPKDRYILFCDESGKGRPVKDVLAQAPKGKWAICIGPEGGFTERECNMLHEKENVYPVTLGPRIMRADTAALAALTIWQEHLGDWDENI